MDGKSLLWIAGAIGVLALFSNLPSAKRTEEPAPTTLNVPAPMDWAPPVQEPSQLAPSTFVHPAPVPYPPLSFYGRTCTHDCSGHEAGYEWAGEQGITDPDECSGNSQSFIEGCEAYAEERQQEMEDEAE